MMNSNSVASVFDTGYIRTTKSATLTKAITAYFCIGDVSDSLRKTTGLRSQNTNASANVASSNFWQLIATNFTQGFTEKFSVHNTVSESVALFATGTSPIEIGITGKLLISGSEDYRLDFLRRYVEDFRMRRLSQASKHLTFVSQDTQFNLLLQTIVLNDGSNSETYTDISMQGYGYRFRSINSSEAISYGYYGKTSGVATYSDPVSNTQEAQVSTSDPEVQKVPVQTNSTAREDAKTHDIPKGQQPKPAATRPVQTSDQPAKTGKNSQPKERVPTAEEIMEMII